MLWIGYIFAAKISFFLTSNSILKYLYSIIKFTLAIGARLVHPLVLNIGWQ